MIQKEDESLIKNLEKNAFCHMRKKIITVVLQCEYNMLINFLRDIKTVKTIYLREMHGYAGAFMEKNFSQFNTNLEFFFFFPKNKGEKVQINDLIINNVDPKNIYINNYVYKVNLIYQDEWVNYKKSIFRFTIQNEDKRKNKTEKETKNSFDEKSNNKIIINNSNNLNESNFIDSVVIFHVDINNNTTILINELYYNINENDFLRFYDIIIIFYEKLKIFIDKNFNIYLCNESILINRSITQIFNYIMSLNIFYNERFLIKDIQKFKDEINIFVNVRDKIYPDFVYQARCHILKLSEISSFVSIVALIDKNHFSLKERFLTLKAAIILVLKIIKKNIEKEFIEN